MIAAVIIVSFLRPIVSLAILDVAPGIYPILQGLLLTIVVPFAIYYGISGDPMTTILTWLYNWINGEFNFDSNGWDFLFVIIRVVLHIVVSWFAGIVYYWLRNSIPMAAALAPQNVSALTDVGAYFVYACAALMFYLFEINVVMWTRDAYGAFAVYFLLYVGVAFSGFTLMHDVVDFGMTLAVSAATQQYNLTILWIFLVQLGMVAIAALLYFLFFMRRINTLSKAKDNDGDAVEMDGMPNAVDPIPEPLVPTLCKRPVSASAIPSRSRRYNKLNAKGPRSGKNVFRNGGITAEDSAEV